MLGRLRGSPWARGRSAHGSGRAGDRAIRNRRAHRRRSSDQIDTAKYTLAATADDIVQNLPTADSRTWTQYSMLVRFFNERMGGVRFFKELERAKQNPAVNLGVLEVMHACFSLGFEGVYRASGGPGAAQGVRRDLYEPFAARSRRQSRIRRRIGAAKRFLCRAAASRFRSGRSPRLRPLSCSAHTSICATPFQRARRPSP